ncbi:DUF397 domain-containing protein [Amycolatopsis vancoresmycina]|uniref:DUF397 domain-containing protein n=1 Tax=Amycolatopsis vancoresmycina TaxID=208444 RepID=UPI001969CA9B|nr:DUF397 domain-containing protein [Amycolatopsis vancoresmycina]
MAREQTWFKSSYSEGQEHQTCVEVAVSSKVTAVRDSKAPTAGHLTVPHRAWTAMLSTLR